MTAASPARPDASEDERPRDIAAERAVLGAMMLSPDAVADVTPILTERDFYRPAHGRLYATLTDLWESGHPTDPVALAARLEADQSLQRVGGAPYLHTLIATVPTAANAGYYAEIVADRAARARLVDAGQRLLQLGAHAGGDVGEVQEAARSTVDEATRSRVSTESGAWVGDVIDEHMAAWEQPDTAGLPWPYADLDELTCGMKPGQLVLVAARPAVGKSTVGMDCARHAARHGTGVLFVSLEMSRDELLMRLACAEARVRLSDVRARTVSAADRLRLKAARETIAGLPLRVEDPSGMTLGQVRAAAREQARGPRGLGLLVVDYLQLMTSGGRVESRQQEVSEFSRQLKVLARELAVPVVAISQLNRGPEQRADKKPMLSDLRESGSLEQDADVVMLISRPDVVEREDPRAGEADLIVAKNRGGPTATITVAHQLHYCRFTDLARGYAGGRNWEGDDTRY